MSELTRDLMLSIPFLPDDAVGDALAAAIVELADYLNAHPNEPIRPWREVLAEWCDEP